jgi:hypothetical protein
LVISDILFGNTSVLKVMFDALVDQQQLSACNAMTRMHASWLLQPDLCRKAFGRVLVCVAVLALLVMQAGMVWHGIEHVAKASGKITYSTNSLSAEKSQPSSGLCLKCLEDLTHSVGLITQQPYLDDSSATALQQAGFVACIFLTPVELVNQRGPPVFLS